MRGHFFDVIIVGSETSGLVAGALLKRRGYRVMQVDFPEQSAQYIHEGYVLPCAPTFLHPPEKSLAISPVLKELALSSASYRELGIGVERFQSIIPGHRVDIFPDTALFKGEIKREFSAESAGFDGAMETLEAVSAELSEFLKRMPPIPPSGFFEKRHFKRYLEEFKMLSGDECFPRSFFKAGEAGRVASAPVTFTAQSDGCENGPLAAYSLRSVFQKNWISAFSISGLKLLLKKRMRDLGTILLPGQRPSMVETDGSVVTGLTLDKNSLSYNCAAMIIAAPLEKVIPIMPEGKKRERIEKLEENRCESKCLVTINMVVPFTAVPEGMGNAVILSDGPSGQGNPYPVSLSIFPAILNKVHKKEFAVASAVMIVDKKRLSGGSSKAVRELKEELKKRVARPFPFIVEKAVLVSSPYEGELMSNIPGSAVGRTEYCPVDLVPCAGSVQELIDIQIKMPWTNIYTASRQVFPGLGLDGEFLSGRIVADTISRMNPRK